MIAYSGQARLRYAMESTELAFAGVAVQAELVRAGEVSPQELVELCLERIRRIDPQINAFRIVFEERARTEAEQAAARLKAGDERPLLGVPVAIKDNTDIAGELTPNGTSAHGGPAAEDAEVVKRVRAAGAIVIGKTHVPELCMFPYGESATWGRSRNPWSLDHGTGGSSAGSGAAVAAGLVPAALGTDGAGSIRIPAGVNRLFGLKPQRGRVSLAPLREHWHGLTMAGWLTRGVVDNALMLDATAGPADGDTDFPPAPERSFVESARTPPGKLRVAWSAKVPPGAVARVGSESRRALSETVELLRSLGHQVVERDPDYGLVFLNVLVRYLSGIQQDVAGMPHPERLERRTRAMGRLGAAVAPVGLARARAAEPELAARMNAIFDDHDVLLTPLTTGPPLTLGRFEGRGALYTLNHSAAWVPHPGPWNAVGNPAASIPARFTDDRLPMAVQLVTAPNAEGTLLSLAAQIEAERPWRADRPPIAV
jgi:amidase